MRVERVGLIMVALFAGCGGETKATLVLPADVNAAIVLEGENEAFVVTRTGPPLKLIASDDEVVVLYYATAQFEANADGKLVRAGPNEDPEHVWPLPPTRRGAVYSPDEQSFVDLTDTERLDALTASIQIPAPPCGSLRARTSRTLDFRLQQRDLESLASIGDVMLMSSETSVVTTARLLLLTGDDLERELFLDHPLAHQTRLQVFEDQDTFWVVESSTTSGIDTYRATVTGEITRLTHTATLAPKRIAGLVHWPETTQLYARINDEDKVVRFDSATGLWTTVVTLSGGPDESRCEAFRDRQQLALEGPDSGVVSFLGYGPHRFQVGGAVDIAADADLPPPCSSAYARFPSGLETVQYVLGARSDGSNDLRIAWRADASSAWAVDSFPRLVKTLTTQGTHGIGFDSALNDIALVTYDPNRPDRRPRICHRLGTGDVRAFVTDGNEGRLIQMEEATRPIYLLRFGLDPP